MASKRSLKMEDEDGIDGPFERAMKRAMKEDAKMTYARQESPFDPAANAALEAERADYVALYGD
jgi:hypothetical protein